MMDEIRIVTPFGFRQIGYERHRSEGLLSSANACNLCPSLSTNLGKPHVCKGLALISLHVTLA